MSNGNAVGPNSVAGESGPMDFFEARLPDQPAPIRIEYSAIRYLRAGFAASGATIGLLVGSSSEEALHIRFCELLCLARETLADPKLLESAMGQFIQSRLQNPIEGSPQLLGFFRAQTGGYPAMSEADRQIASQCLPASNGLFLLIQTTAHRPWTAALFGLDGVGKPAVEFPFDEYLLRNGYMTDSLAPLERDPIQTARVPVLNAKRIAIALFIATLLGGTAAYNWFRPTPGVDIGETDAASSGPLALRVNRTGGDFEVTWDRLSNPVRQAASGTLTIHDGEITKSLRLTGEQLREGRILYSPLFGQLNFRLEITTKDGKAEAESVQVLEWNAPAPAPQNPAH